MSAPPVNWYGLEGRVAHLPSWGPGGVAWVTRCGHRLDKMEHATPESASRCAVCVRSAVASGLLSASDQTVA